MYVNIYDVYTLFYRNMYAYMPTRDHLTPPPRHRLPPSPPPPPFCLPHTNKTRNHELETSS